MHTNSLTSILHSQTPTHTHLALTHLQVTNRWLASTPHTRWPPDSTQHTQSPLHPGPEPAREHALQVRLLLQKVRHTGSPSDRRDTVLSPGTPRATPIRPPTSLPAHRVHSAPSPAMHTRSPVPVTAPGRAAKVILTGSASRRASPGAASPARAHCSPPSPRRKCRRPRRGPASRPGRPPTPAIAVAAAAAAAARAEGEARGAGPRALPDPAAPSCLERAAKPGRERCEVRAGGRASGRARAALGARLRNGAWTPGPSRLGGRDTQPVRSARAASQRPAGNATPAPIRAEPCAQRTPRSPAVSARPPLLVLPAALRVAFRARAHAESRRRRRRRRC